MGSSVRNITDSPDTEGSFSKATLPKENCCVCGHVTGAQILLTCALFNKWICRTCASHVKAQIEHIRSQEEQAFAKEILLRRSLNFTIPSSDVGAINDSHG